MDEKKVFTDIYLNNKWGNAESVSGSGSTLAATKFLIDELNLLLKRYQIESILDAPCGDFNWMRMVNLAGIDYVGGDIVDNLIAKNKVKYPAVNFQTINLVTDKLPKVDLIFCRDCLSHFSYDMIKKSLENIKQSRSKFLLTTHFTWKSIPNNDINLGGWRRVNLELPPFNLSPPLETIIEGTYQDKSMSLWPIYKL